MIKVIENEVNLVNNNIDKKTVGKVILALEGLNEMTRKVQERTDKKNWSTLSLPLSFHDELTKLTKDDLNKIRKDLDIKNASSLKKGDLVTLLQEEIPLLLKKGMDQMDADRFTIVKQIFCNGGYMKASDLQSNQIEYFRSIGIFTGTHNGQKILAMPQEVIEELSVLVDDIMIKKMVHRNSEWIKLTQGLLYYNGSLGIQTLKETLEKYLKEPINLSAYLSVIFTAKSYYKEIKIDQHGFSNVRVVDSERVLKEHKMRKELEMFDFSKAQLLLAGEPGYIDRNYSYKQFVQFILQDYKISKQEADSIVEECVYAIRIGQAPNQIIEFLQSRLEFNTINILQLFTERVIDLMNNTREWFLKGYTPTELGAREREKMKFQPKPPEKANIINMQTREKIGRNDSCPCGSKKKFKKCCGK